MDDPPATTDPRGVVTDPAMLPASTDASGTSYTKPAVGIFDRPAVVARAGRLSPLLIVLLVLFVLLLIAASVAGFRWLQHAQ